MPRDGGTRKSAAAASPHAPEVGYILSRKRNEDLELVQLRQPLIREIVRSVDDSAFGPKRR